jgi:glycosyltransferase involved in cell wall biosynthesis
LLFVGLVEPRKNLPLLLRAYQAIRQHPAAPHLVIAGRLGWMYEEVFHLVDELGLRGQVHFPGYIPASDLPVLYNLAEVFIYPSLYEGFGLPPLEAMACGTPVVTSGVSSMPEAVGDAGLLVPPGDEQALAGAVLRLAGDPALREELRQKGLSRAQEFTWTRTARETWQVYRQVLQKSQP